MFKKVLPLRKSKSFFRSAGVFLTLPGLRNTLGLQNRYGGFILLVSQKNGYLD
jgi:hypothetical protein